MKEKRIHYPSIKWGLISFGSDMLCLLAGLSLLLLTACNVINPSANPVHPGLTAHLNTSPLVATLQAREVSGFYVQCRPDASSVYLVIHDRFGRTDYSMKNDCQQFGTQLQVSWIASHRIGASKNMTTPYYQVRARENFGNDVLDRYLAKVVEITGEKHNLQ